MYSKDCECSISSLKILYEHFYTPQSGVLDTFIQLKGEKRERRKRTIERHFGLMFSFLAKYFQYLKREKKELFLEFPHYLF